MNIAIRRATPADWPAIVDINDSAFEGPAESALIAALERSGRPVISLVALADDVPAGHIFFSPVRIQSPGPPIPAAALAPMAVSPRFQRSRHRIAAGRCGPEGMRRPGLPGRGGRGPSSLLPAVWIHACRQRSAWRPCIPARAMRSWLSSSRPVCSAGAQESSSIPPNSRASEQRAIALIASPRRRKLSE